MTHANLLYSLLQQKRSKYIFIIQGSVCLNIFTTVHFNNKAKNNAVSTHTLDFNHYQLPRLLNVHLIHVIYRLLYTAINARMRTVRCGGNILMLGFYDIRLTDMLPSPLPFPGPRCPIRAYLLEYFAELY